MKKIAILGSTGSIGTQTLDIIRKNPDRFSVEVLACGRNITLLREQIKEFSPQIVVVERVEDAVTLKNECPGLEVLFGMDGLVQAAASASHTMLLNALVGIRGLAPTYHAIKAGKDIALANKETLVAGGQIVMDAAAGCGVRVLPVDSEHSAVFQCLEAGRAKEVRRIILTASGGPFRGYSREQLAHVTVAQALNHPKWKMGNKITIDSATLMNKGLEVIEAAWLFGQKASKIDVLVHPQSIIHSMVEYHDGSVMAQLGLPDMRIPISYALDYPNRLVSREQSVDFLTVGNLTFEKPDMDTFSCLRMAYEALKQGGSVPVVLNAANEILVELFLNEKIHYMDIQKNIQIIMEEHQATYHLTLDDILGIDEEIRERVKRKWS